MWPLHETCVENFLFSGVLCPCRAMCAVQCTLHIRHIRHTEHVLCPGLSCVCIAMFCARTHTTARLCPFGCRVFLGEYSFGRFPICSQERRRSMVLVSTHTVHPCCSLEECSMSILYTNTVSLLPRQRRRCTSRRRRGISSATGQLPPPLWLAGSGQTLDSGSPLHGGWYHQQPASQCTHTPVQRRP